MSELYKLLSSTADSTGLPLMNTSLFLETVEKYTKEDEQKREQIDKAMVMFLFDAEICAGVPNPDM